MQVVTREKRPQTHLEVGIHNNLLLVGVLERLAPLDGARKEALESLRILGVVQLWWPIATGGDGSAALETSDITS